MAKIAGFLENMFWKGGTRGLLVKKHALYSFCLKIINTIFSLLLIRITLHYLSEYEYGIWVTISSILTWIYSFDIGFGNGLQNKLGESLAKNDMKLSREYVSTAFLSMSFIALMFLLISFILFPFLNWAVILNAKQSGILHLNLYIWIFLGCVVNRCVLYYANVKTETRKDDESIRTARYIG